MADSPSLPRAKRQKFDKQGRFAALQKLKDLKQHGQKHKAELSEEVQNVYDLVDEKEYLKRTSHLGSDWIEDDGTGYTEDGRDIFDDIESDDSNGRENSKDKGKKRKKNATLGPLKNSHRSLFTKKVSKPKSQNENLINLEKDNALANILCEMDTGEKNNTIKPKIIKRSDNHSDNIKKHMDDFIKTLTKVSNEKDEIAKSDDDKIVESILKPKAVPSVAKPLETQNELKHDNNLDPITSKTLVSPKSMEEDSMKHNKNDNLKENDTKNYEEMFQDFIPHDEIWDEPKIEKSNSVATTNAEQDEKELKELLSNWENACKFEETPETSDNKTDDIIWEKLDKTSLRFWYWDAWEDFVKRPGEVFLFGKVSLEDKTKYNSICVHVGNIERVLYLLPREYHYDMISLEPTKQKVTLTDVYNEFASEIAPKLGIKEFKSERVTKNFAFHLPGVDVPETCEYIEIRYDGKKPTPDLKAVYKTISYIFGTNTPFLETFLLECKIKGPCWLTLNNFIIVNNPLSWCKVEAFCSSSSIKHLEEKLIPPPPMTVIALNIKSVVNPKTNKNEVSIISCLVNDKFYIDKPPSNQLFNRHFCGITRPANLRWPFDFHQKFSKFNSIKASKFDSERALLSWFLAIYQNIDPDLIVMHDVNDCQLDLICDRVSALKIPTWSRFGRLRFSQNIGKKWKDYFNGRMICDVKTSAEELIKSRSYDLSTLCQTILKLKENERVELSNDDIIGMYQNSESLLKFITLIMQDCSYILKLMCEMNVLPLALQITTICGNLMSRTLQGGRSERNEFLLLHAFYEKNYIVPDKKKKHWENSHAQLEEDDRNVTVDNKNNQGATRKKAAYTGGLVLEPIKGLYEKYILLMDFNSLYPSIIQEFNICFTTVPEPEVPGEIPPLPESSIEQGILPRQIRRLVESRREVKKLMANQDLDSDLKMQYNIRQLALKLTANSMYGCLGFAQSRFFAQHLASLVTLKGREILMNTKSIVQKLNFEVVYGDTDSIMVNTNSTDYEQVFKIGNSIKQTVNKIYRQIELDIDGVFKTLLLLKKKKYAAVTISKNSKGELVYQKEFKGLDIVRRDWSQIAIMAGKIVLEEILSDKQHDEKIEAIHSHLEKLKENICNEIYPLPILTITKQLTKAPKDYSSGLSNLPHVIVALRMNETKNKRYKKGDMVSYIICEDGTQNAAMQRAYHLDELKTNENLKVDINYYLAQQIHPVVMRLCEPLEGTDGARIAECLGLDPKKFRTGHKTHQSNEPEIGTGEAVTKTSLQKYRQCEKFKFICNNCKTVNIIASAFRPHEKTYIPVLQKCSNVDCSTAPYQYLVSIRNQMILSIREFIKRFYDNWMICDEPTCNNNTRKLLHVAINNRPICFVCNTGVLIRAYSERDLYNQISYFQYIFDLSNHEHKNVTVPGDVEVAYNTLKETVDNILEKSAYCTINLNKLFADLKPSSQTDVIPDKDLC
ncbi:DNA polymerase alpha catalytic subunit isoform X2 [Condylostylus longicornis]|uniref:DNA polymerase alpha catalytic subunit isoform X2 n=1 Tax=Condylostylus longicornis TaxID=2530218 RepID=UPI00244DAD31|nr:DNA polymerase alpha catalytic subunit isoform X2 [Condylostylus longicornis]